MPTETERDWFDRIGEMRWQHAFAAFLAAAIFVALLFSPAMTCGVSIKSTDSTTTTTEARR